ncbi:MAG: ATP-binding cassette domain-containing protein [Clostridia bacterium]|nr:ATP-binding cassette domain-containing protein [Clostridia bacterium]
MKLILQNISKSYGSVRALSDFSAELTPGIYALLGPNGSGKTTLMHILTDNLRADTGVVLYADGDEEPQNVKGMGKEFREKLGFMPQYPGMYPNFTAKQFLQYVAALKGVGEKQKKRERDAQIEKQITEILDELELSDVAHRRIGTFSGGMKQRLALAQAVLGDPKILILDEPTAGLDPKQRIAVRNYISRISQDKIVIIATHVVSDIEFIAKEIIMLRKGVITDSGSPYDLTRKIEGKVWQVAVNPEEVQPIQDRFRVVNIQNSEQGVILRILSDNKPTENSVTVVPSLEDYYLHVFGEVL